MKLSEKLSQIKQKEGHLTRLYSLRDTVAKQEFKETIITREKDSSKLLEKKKSEFTKQKIAKFNAITKEIKHEIIESKNRINRINVEKGIDMKLAEMKHLRIELSKLMELVKKGYLTDRGIDLEIWEQLGAANRIKELETRKSKLDSQIQQINWSMEV